MKVRANLKRIENLTYQFSNDQADMLKDLNSKVQDLFNHFHSLLPQKDGFVLRPKGSQSVIIMRRKIRKARLTLTCSSLSTTLKGKKMTKALTQRVGAKADWTRNLLVCLYYNYVSVVGMDNLGRNFQYTQFNMCAGFHIMLYYIVGCRW